jgi:hypothetical protein
MELSKKFDLSDSLPEDLAEVRRQIQYWMSRQNEAEAGSNWDHSVRNKIDQLRWQEQQLGSFAVKPTSQMSARETPVIFLSCGQYREDEKALGKRVKELLEENGSVEVYFAENQSTFDAFTKNILGALNRCVGFIGIMHHRGEVGTSGEPVTRASVWIEQEIAIAAFIEQILNRKVEVQLYIQEGIAREGMRDKLLLNAQSFRESSEVLDHFARNVERWQRLGRATVMPDPVREANYKRGFDQTKASFFVRTRRAGDGQETRSGTYFLISLIPASFPAFDIDLTVRNAFTEDIYETFPRHKVLARDQGTDIAAEVTFEGAREFILRVASQNQERRWGFTQDGTVRFITQSVWSVAGSQNQIWSAYDIAVDTLSFLRLAARFWNRNNYRWDARLYAELKIEKAQLHSDNTGYPTLFHQLTTAVPEVLGLDRGALLHTNSPRGSSLVFEDITRTELNAAIAELAGKVAGEMFNGLGYEVDLQRLREFMEQTAALRT